jgi:DNA invertase Pin-like site-specific DNA recombinase
MNDVSIMPLDSMAPEGSASDPGDCPPDQPLARRVRLRPHTDAVGRLLFTVLAMVAELESDLIRLRTREGMKVAKAKGRLRGKQPKLNRRQEAHLVSLVHSGEYSTLEVAELFGVGRSTVYRAIERQRVEARAGLAG